MVTFISQRLRETSTWVGIVTLLAYIVMYFTPDDVDAMILKFIEMIGGGTILASSAFNIYRKD
jgi:hypothetical protein